MDLFFILRFCYVFCDLIRSFCGNLEWSFAMLCSVSLLFTGQELNPAFL